MQFIAEMFLKGHSCRNIAVKLCDHVGKPNYITYRTVNNDINALIKEWEKDRISEINKQKLIELEKVNKLERTYWMAWEKSIEDYEKKAKKIKGALGTDKKGNALKPSEQELQTTNMISFGNPAYLAGIERCIERRCKILGINAPKEVDVKTNGESLNKGFYEAIMNLKSQKNAG